MDIRLLEPDLRRLDDTSVELCACTVWSDERPMRGLAGLLDWRLAGRLSGLLASGFLVGEAGESLLVPGKPHVPFEKLLVMGLGPRAAFDDAVFRSTVHGLARTLEGLRVRRAVVELPGRGVAGIDAERAITLALECLGAAHEHDTWWLVEESASQRVVEERLRRRPRAVSVPEA